MDEFIDISYPIAIKEDKNGSIIRLVDFDKYFVGSSREKALTHLYIYLLNHINFHMVQIQLPYIFYLE